MPIDMSTFSAISVKISERKGKMRRIVKRKEKVFLNTLLKSFSLPLRPRPRKSLWQLASYKLLF